MIASVPLQGTYLPYTNNQFKGIVKMSFRPLTGDLSSLQMEYDYSGLASTFPSPYRGLIFLTAYFLIVRGYDALEFPSPYRGLIFLTYRMRSSTRLTGFRPLTGDLSSLLSHPSCQPFELYGFRPLTGDLSSLLVLM